MVSLIVCLEPVDQQLIMTFILFVSNNMLYPKEDKENKVLLYAVSVSDFVL
jgi:hypothetical protein